MDFNLNEEQTLFRDSVRAFAERHLAANALERAHSDDYPWDVARMMAEQGLLGITASEEHSRPVQAWVSRCPAAAFRNQRDPVR